MSLNGEQRRWGGKWPFLRKREHIPVATRSFNGTYHFSLFSSNPSPPPYRFVVFKVRGSKCEFGGAYVKARAYPASMVRHSTIKMVGPHVHSKTRTSVLFKWTKRPWTLFVCLLFKVRVSFNSPFRSMWILWSDRPLFLENLLNGRWNSVTSSTGATSNVDMD